MPLQTSTTTLLQRIGGRAALEAAIDGLYYRLLNDESLQIFFENVDLRWLKIHQKQFLTAAFTTTQLDLEVTLNRLRRSHARLFEKQLSEKHFDAVAMHLVDTLQGLNLSKEVIDEVVQVVAPLRAAFQRRPESLKRSPKRKVPKSGGFFRFFSLRRPADLPYL